MKAKGPCSVDGCNKPANAARGLCGTHYSRWQRGYDLDKPVRKFRERCSVDGCTEKHLAKGFCSAHYQRVLRHADPMKGGPIGGRDAEVKWCCGCETPVPLSGYHLRPNGKPLVYCKECSKERNNAYSRRYRSRLVMRRRRYAAANLDRLRRSARDLYSRNREREINRVKRRNALRRGAPVATMTAGDWNAILHYFDHRCAYCLERVPALEQDHIEPVSRGGADIPENIVPACRSCNARKNCLPVFFMVAETTPPIAYSFRRVG